MSSQAAPFVVDAVPGKAPGVEPDGILVETNGAAPRNVQSHIRLLRWIAILIPVLFLVSIDAVRHTIFDQQLHTLVGFIVVNGAIAIGVAIFSFGIFGLVGRLQGELAERNRRISALNSLAKAAAEELRLEELLSVSLDHILPAMRADAGLVCLLDMERGEHTAACSRGFSPQMVSRIKRAKIENDPMAREAVRTGRQVSLDQVMNIPDIAERAAKEGIKSAITTPLKSEGQVNGLLVVATRSERRMEAREKEFLEGIGTQLGIAIQNAILYDRSQRRNLEMAALHLVSKAVSSSLDLEQLLARSLEAVIEVTSTDAAEVWLTDGDRELVMHTHRGSDGKAFLAETRFAVGEGLIGAAAQQEGPLVVHDLPSDPRFLRKPIADAGFHTFCAMPLRYRGGLVGVLAAAATSPHALKRPFDISLLNGIAERLAVAIANARLYNQIREIGALQERERIAREMHDGMAQLLGYINTQTLAVKKLLSSGRNGEALEELTRMEDIARDLYGDVREGILGLRTASRKDTGLVLLLHEYIEHFKVLAQIDVSVQETEDVQGLRLPSNIEVQLMRIIQEGLSNVRKHARASAAKVILTRDGNTLQTEIIDNGQGFDPQHIRSRGWPRFGLQTMQERAQSVGGTMTIESSPGQGARVLVRVPLSGVGENGRAPA